MAVAGRRRATPTSAPRGRATSWVVLGSLVGGLTVYAFQVVGTRGLGDEAYAPISVLWTLQYLALSVPLIAVEAYVTRAGVAGDGDRDGAHHLRMLAPWLIAAAALIAGISFVFADALFLGLADLSVVLALIVLAYGGFVVVRGELAGAERFRAYGGATGGESAVRLALGIGVLLLAPSTRSLAWVLPAGPIAVVAWWAIDRRRRGGAAPPRSDRAASGRQAAVRFLVLTTIANGAAQTILAAGPLVLVPLGASAGEISVFFVTATAARAPLVFALGGLLSRLLPPLTRLARAGDAAALRRVALALTIATMAVSTVGAGAAWSLGPEIVTLFFGPSFTPGRAFVALIVGGILACTGALLLNQVLIARTDETRMAAAWVLALTAAVVALMVLTDAAPTMRATYALVAGAVVAVTGLLVAILTAPPLSPAVAGSELDGPAPPLP